MTVAPIALTSVDQFPLDPITAHWDLTASPMPVGMPLSPVWQMLILGDGSMTRTLGILTGQPIRVEVLGTQAGIGIPKVVAEFLGTTRNLVQRRVFLQAAGGERLLYAVSWWQEEALATYLPQPQRPIGQALAQQRLEVYREILGLYQGTSAPLGQVWQYSGSLWGRRYGMWHQQRPLTLIDEVFSPHLARLWM